MLSQIEAFLEAQDRERRRSPNTIAAYRNDLSQLIRFLHEGAGLGDPGTLRSWSEVTADHLAAFRTMLTSSDYAGATVARKIAAVRAFVSFLERNGDATAGLADSLVAPPVKRHVPAALSRKDIQRLLDQPLASGTNRRDAMRDRAMLLVLYRTGIRVSELVALNLEDLDVKRCVLTVRGTRAQTRSIRLQEDVIEVIQSYLQDARALVAHPAEEALFVNHRGARLTRQGFWLIVKTYAGRMGIRDMTPHTLRHSFAVHAIEDGRSVRDVQQALGHVSASATRVYRDHLPPTAGADD